MARPVALRRGHAEAVDGGVGQPLGDLVRAGEGALAVTADEQAGADELLDGGADGGAGDAELGGELTLGGQPGARARALDHLQDVRPHPITQNETRPAVPVGHTVTPREASAPSTRSRSMWTARRARNSG